MESCSKTQTAMRLLLLLFISFSASIHSYGQPNSTPTPFPTYQQIKPAGSEIIDYVSKSGDSHQTQQTRINLFDYLPKTVTYVLNGKPTTDVNYAKRVLSRKEIQIETITIGQQTIRSESSESITRYSSKQDSPKSLDFGLSCLRKSLFY